jgi:hypothetical protein
MRITVKKFFGLVEKLLDVGADVDDVRVDGRCNYDLDWEHKKVVFYDHAYTKDDLISVSGDVTVDVHSMFEMLKARE